MDAIQARLLLVVLLSYVSLGRTLECYTCAASANDTCTERTAECDGGVCWVTKQIMPTIGGAGDGKIIYDKGCRKTCPASTLHTKSSCCSADLCNGKFVQQTPQPLDVVIDFIPPPLHIKCHKCGDDWFRPYCTQGTERCTGVCYVTKKLISGAPFYTHGCSPSCPIRPGTVDGYCCNKELCNGAAEDPGENIGSDYRRCYYSEGSGAVDPNRQTESIACQTGYCYINKHTDAMGKVRYYKGCTPTCPDNSTSSQYFCCYKNYCNSDLNTMTYSINTVRELECAQCQNGNSTCGADSRQTCYGTCYTVNLGGELFTKGCRGVCKENKETSCCNTDKCNSDYNVVKCEYCENEEVPARCNKTLITCDGSCYTTISDLPEGKLYTKGCRASCKNTKAMVNAQTTDCCTSDLCNAAVRCHLTGGTVMISCLGFIWSIALFKMYTW